MAISIVRNDITKMNVDAIVNTTNEHFVVGGLGVDAGIHYAAGPRLQEALDEIGFCPVGSAVITDSFALNACRYIIHTVGPVYIDGTHGERSLLESCYRSILRLAREHGCRSLAIPATSTGAYGYPKTEAYHVATSCIREFLFSLPDDEDMMVYLVLYDPESVAVSEKIDAAVEHQITDREREEKKEKLFQHYKKAFEPNMVYSRRRANRPPRPAAREEASLSEDFFQEAVASISYDKLLADSMPAAAPAPAPEEDYEDVDLSFAEMCEWWCRQKGISKKRFYSRANINKSMFWGMKHHPNQIPKKTNALACAIGLELDYEQSQDLLKRAGMTLSKYYELDRIVEQHIRNEKYDIDEINLILFDKDLPLLGTF